nr:stage III sporulation protein AF [Clostridia bacterium]
MLEFISVWAQGIIVSVIIATIIEMILPNSSNSKYIKVVIGVFILFTIISPIINKFSSNKISDKINFDSYIDTSTNNSAITTNVNLNNEDTIRKMYEENLKIDIKTKITQKGYTVGNINLDILNNDEYTLSKIDLKIVAKNESINQNNNTNVTTIVENIENIRVDIGGSSKNKEEEKSVISESEKRKLKEYLSSVYEVSENNIFVN